MRALARRVINSQESGLILVVVLVTVALTLLAGSHIDRRTGEATVSGFGFSFRGTCGAVRYDPDARKF